ncbi:MAG TPA: protocatechuate 4,5-dioxygenase subunit alpha [Ramlibacter sp.]|uniref:protocatechuate 4,5-dioxygenase subunit alpha n=1 Tax=Ramlibacter sp. TaxID=1917967 RepID=UPI002D7F8635|nr:protocatechuate 4,5-dioxygenase subunit alpha [Ramlibacter sp.]HET8744700.1 protocatechuate 4,5-dioxygenase subunit alpha [Ramlibacter sp.]
MNQARPPIFGTTIFDGTQARKGYALNRMCFSFNEAANRDAFKADEEAYMRRYGLNEAQAWAVRERNVPGLLAAGGNVYYLAKFAGILGLDVQDLGALQTGLSKEEFKARLVRQNEQPVAFVGWQE